MSAVAQHPIHRIYNVKWGQGGSILAGGANAMEPSGIRFNAGGSVLAEFPLPDYIAHDEVHFPGYPDQPIDTFAITGLANGNTAVGYGAVIPTDAPEPDLANDTDLLIVYDGQGSRLWSDLQFSSIVDQPDESTTFRGTRVWSLAGDKDSNIYAVIGYPLFKLRAYAATGGAMWNQDGQYVTVSCSGADTIVTIDLDAVMRGYSTAGSLLWSRTLAIETLFNCFSRNRHSLMAVVDYTNVIVFNPETGTDVWSTNPTSSADDRVAGVDFGDDGTLYILIDNRPSSGPIVTRIERYAPVIEGGEVQSYSPAPSFNAILTDAQADGYDIGGSFYNITDSAGLVFSNGLLLCGHADSSFHEAVDSDWTEFAFSVHAFRSEDGGHAWSKDWGLYTLGAVDARLPQWASLSAIGR